MSTIDRLAIGPHTPRRSAATADAVFVGRAVKRVFRRPDTVVSTVVFPAVLLLTLIAVFSTAVEAFEGDDYAQRLVPGLIVSGLMFGSVGTAIGFWMDRESGFMDRIRSMPVPTSAPLVGTVIAETVRALLAVAVLVALGVAFGFRFSNGVVPGIWFVVVAGVAAMSLSFIGLSMATVAKSQESLGPPLGALFLVLLFFSEGMIPLEGYPGWAQPVVRAAPATAYVNLLDHLARGGQLVRPMLAAGAWSIALVGVLGTFAVTRLRRVASG
ncbi:MAG: ABC transporter permease [Desertimonas sp.]